MLPNAELLKLIEKPRYTDNVHRLEHNAELMHIISEWNVNKSVAILHYRMQQSNASIHVGLRFKAGI